MTAETAMWIFGVTLLPLIAWGVNVTWCLYQIRAHAEVLVKRSENKELEECVRANTRAIKGLTHYIRWSAEAQTGKVPPPPLDEEP